MAEDSGPHTIDVLANDADPDNEPLSVVSATTPSHGHASVGATSMTYTPTADYNGLDHFTYTVRHQHGAVAKATVTVTVTAVNDAPQARDDRYDGEVGHAVSGSVLDNDRDIDGDPLHVASDDSATVHVGSGGGFSFTPSAAGTVTVHYVVSDGHAHDTGTLTIVVAAAPPPNQPSRLYLRGSSTTATGDLTASAPTAAATDWDGDKHPGLTIRDGDLKVTTSDPAKYQQWSYATPSAGLKLSGPISLDLWSTPKQRKDQDIDYSAWLYSCNSSGASCQLLTSATNVHVHKWSTTTTWERRTIGIGSVSTTVPSGRVVKLRLQFHRSDMWLALDAAHPASLVL
jgi:Bacterial Ig domain